MASLMIAHSFFMGCGTVFFETAASASFLSRYASSWLPWVYVAAAGVNTVTGTVYARAQSRVSFARLMRGTLGFLLVLVLAVRLGFAISGMAWVAFAGLVSYRIISSLTDLEYWAVASRIYDVRQAKRLFGLIGTGEVVARIVGAFCVPLLVHLGGVSNLMLLSAGSLAICLYLVGKVMRSVASAGAPSQRVAVDAVTSGPHAVTLAQRLRGIVASRYLLAVVTVAVLATFGKYFVDFAFLEQVSTLSKGESELATVLGLFSGITQTLSLLTRMFVSRPLLAWLGIRVGILVLPLAQAVCTLAIVVVGFSGMNAAIIWLVIANQGIYKTLKHPIDNASFKVLYQPLKADERLAVQIAVEIVFSPVVVGLAGLVMVLFSSVLTYDPVKFCAVLLAVFVGWLVAAHASGRAYATKLFEILRRRLEGDVPFVVDDATTLEVLKARVQSDDPAEVCVALSLLESAGSADVLDVLLAQTGHADAAVRRYAIERLLVLEPGRLAGIRHLDDRDELVRRAALTVLFSVPGPQARALATAALGRFATGAEAADRRLAASLAGAHGVAAVVTALLDDPDFGVRRAAILAAGPLDLPALRPLLVRYLLEPRFAQAAARAIAWRGDDALSDLAALFDERGDPLVLRRVTYVYRQIGTPAATHALAAHLDVANVTVRGRVLATLDLLGWTATGAMREQVSRRLRDEALASRWAHAAERDLRTAPELQLVREALRGEVLAARARILSLLSFVHDRVTVHRVAIHLTHAARDKRAFAHELLDVLLDSDERSLLLPLLSDTATTDSPRGALRPEERIEELLRRPPGTLSEWTLAVTRYALAARDPRPKDAPMLPIEKVILLKTIPMFAQTREEVVAEIASIVEVVQHEAGDVIFRKGDVGDSMYVVVSGEVRVFDGERTLSVLGEREIFGELALLDPEPRSASVAATKETRLFRLDSDLFSQLMAANVDVVRGVLRVLCDRLRRTSAAASPV